MGRLLMNGASVAYDLEPRVTIHKREGSISFSFSGPNRERYVRVRAEALTFAENHGLLRGRPLDDAREALFTAIRGLYSHDPEGAQAFYNSALPARYAPPPSTANTTPYVWSCRLLGFGRAERLRRAVRR